MKHPSEYQPVPASEVCAKALERGSLILVESGHWRAGSNRLFGVHTVNKLLASGVAVRIDDMITTRRALAEAGYGPVADYVRTVLAEPPVLSVVPEVGG